MAGYPRSGWTPYSGAGAAGSVRSSAPTTLCGAKAHAKESDHQYERTDTFGHSPILCPNLMSPWNPGFVYSGVARFPHAAMRSNAAVASFSIIF